MFLIVREFERPADELIGNLLVAAPTLLDPNFRRALVLMAEHDQKNGALGFVVNRPSGKTVADLLPDQEEIGSLAIVPVLIGGPVATDRLTFAAFRWGDGRFSCRAHLPAEEAREMMHDPLRTVRAFAGYSGWGAGQLEAELAHQAWVVQSAEADLFESGRGETEWREIMRSLGPYYRLAADVPDDPSLN